MWLVWTGLIIAGTVAALYLLAQWMFKDYER